MTIESLAEEVSFLKEEERSELESHEHIIERGLKTFYEVGTALLAIRDKRLYRENYKTFKEYCDKRWGVARRHAYRLIDAAKVVESLSPMGDKSEASENVSHGTQNYPIPIEEENESNYPIPQTERQARPLTQLETPEARREAWKEANQKAQSEGRKATAKDVSKAVEHKKKPHVSNNSGENEWYTPPQFIKAARRVMGSIDVDPASSELANSFVKASTFYTKESNGLEEPWPGNVWLNSPYAQPLVAQFSEAVIRKWSSGEIEQICVLVNNATETQWFQEMMQICSAICFLKGRVRFIDTEGNPSGAPLQGQVVIYFGGLVESFVSEFSRLGVVMRRS